MTYLEQGLPDAHGYNEPGEPLTVSPHRLGIARGTHEGQPSRTVAVVERVKAAGHIVEELGNELGLVELREDGREERRVERGRRGVRRVELEEMSDDG